MATSGIRRISFRGYGRHYGAGGTDGARAPRRTAPVSWGHREHTGPGPLRRAYAADAHRTCQEPDLI